MREFFVLSFDDREDLEAVSDFDMGDFDATALWTGQSFTGSIPAGVRLWVSEGDPTDYMGNPVSWQIASKRLWSIVQPLVGEECQALDVPLYYEKSDKRVSGYLLLNPTKRITATTKATSGPVVEINNLVLERSQIPLDVNIFRLAESSTVILVSDAVVNLVWGKELKGLVFLRTKGMP